MCAYGWQRGAAASHHDRVVVGTDELDRIGTAYLARLTETDLRALVHADSADPAEAAARIAALRRQPALVLDVLDRPATSRAVLNLAARRGGDREFAFISPFLVFAAAIHRTAADLAATSYAPERVSGRMRVPVFDAAQLAEYLNVLRHRLFLADLLASFARTSSGMAITRTPRGLRRRRWTDADPAQLAVLLETLPPMRRPAVWRRLGDVALFLAGVFPGAAEHVVATRLDATRLARRTGLAADAVPDTDTRDLIEWLGSGWYRLAADRAAPAAGADAALREAADKFRPARRVLNAASDRYLFPAQSGWFTQP